MWGMDVFGCDAGSGICRLFEAWRVMGAFTRAYARIFILPPLRGFHLTMDINLIRFCHAERGMNFAQRRASAAEAPLPASCPLQGKALLPDPSLPPLRRVNLTMDLSPHVLSC
jgi:hypothetical protein